MRDGQAEPHLPISALKYTCVKFQILMQCICYENICADDSNTSVGWGCSKTWWTPWCFSAGVE
jgi:hypothetical protein